MRTVYLAGPIVGCTHGEANDWRVDFAMRLKDAGITGVSPLRCEPLVGDTYPASNGDPRFGTARAIGSKNVYDVRTCDMALIYLPKGSGINYYDKVLSLFDPLISLLGQQDFSVSMQADVNHYLSLVMTAVSDMLGHASYGTIIEMAWAYILGTPTIVVTDDEEVRNHPVINSNASWMLDNLDDAFDVISGVLGGYVVGGKHV